MAKREPGATLPVVVVRGSHADLGRAMGRAQQVQIQRVVATALESLHDLAQTDADIRAQNAPFLDAAARTYPEFLVELQAMARAADVPFDVLFRLNCYEARPPGMPVGPPAPGPAMPAKDPTELRVANDPAAVAAMPATGPTGPGAEGSTADGCTSIASLGPAGVVVGHTEDSSPEAVAGLYLLDATLLEPTAATGRPGGHFKALNYAQTLPGCAAGVNADGLIVLIDALPDPDRRRGAPRHFVSRALLDFPTIDEAIDHLRSTERGGGWNYLMVQGRRIANVEATAKRVVVLEATSEGTFAHSNHYLDPEIAADAGEPRANSVARLGRALELVTPGMNVGQMANVLADRQGFPDSICRDRTIGAFLADTASRQLQVCWGEPEGATWSTYAF